MTGAKDPSDVRESVRDHYARAATEAVEASACCAPSCCGDKVLDVDDVRFRSLYEPEAREDLPDAAILASLGCGNPTAVVELHEGETVLDLGSGGGIDVLLSARRVGPSGKAYGLDMTEEMLALARQNQQAAGATNVEFLEGYLEDIPLPAEAVDVVISNCVINLSTDKPRVFAEMHRVLAPGGRIGVSDIVAANELTPDQRAERGSFAGCIAGALSFAEYEDGLRAVGFSDIELAPTHEVADQMFAAIIKATKPSDG
jgi:ubiquinone/menaquinone biosynthesis C-methylase UbiE